MFHCLIFRLCWHRTSGTQMSSGIVHYWLQSCLRVVRCMFGNEQSAATSMTWRRMSWMWRSTDEAQVNSNTYSCKTGSLCDSGRPSRREQYSLRPRTHGSQWKAIDQQGMRETQWDEPKQENRKQQKVTAGQSTRRQRNGSRRRLVAAITKTRMKVLRKHISTARWDSPHASWMNISRESCPDLHNLNDLIDRICNSVSLQELRPPQTSYCWTATAICWAAVVLIWQKCVFTAPQMQVMTPPAL